MPPWRRMRAARHGIEYGSDVNQMPLGCRLNAAGVATKSNMRPLEAAAECRICDNVGMTTDGAGWIWYNMRRLGKQSGKEKPHYG